MQPMWSKAWLKPRYNFIVTRKYAFIAIAIAAVTIFIPTIWHFFPKVCFFDMLTGYPCPFCGLTRSFIDLGNLRILSAIQHNILSIPLFITFLFLPVRLFQKRELRIPLAYFDLFILTLIVATAWLVKIFVVSRSFW